MFETKTEFILTISCIILLIAITIMYFNFHEQVVSYNTTPITDSLKQIPPFSTCSSFNQTCSECEVCEVCEECSTPQIIEKVIVEPCPEHKCYCTARGGWADGENGSWWEE